jgi:hypothetical protein
VSVPLLTPLAEAGAVSDVPAQPPQYLLVDPPAKGAVPNFVALGKGEGVGAIVDGLRVVAGPGTLRAAKEVTEPALQTVQRIPAWLGGGFVFVGATSLYRADTFDGPLASIATLPAAVSRISFGPKSMLVRCNNGERWHFELPSGKRTSLEPQGLADFAALANGRAIAFSDSGATLVSVDQGAHWTDVSAKVRGTPVRVFAQDGALWLKDSTDHAVRVEAGGHLASFDKAPTEKPPELRPKDPRWHSDETPLHKAFRLGVPMDDTTALVASDGDVVRVNVATGEIVSVMSGKLPPDAMCEGVRTVDDVLMVCAPKSGMPFVASHLLGDKSPAIETFMQAGQFFASDDGSLAFAGPCQRAKASRSIVCVRTQGGAWQELDLDNVADAGTLEVSRWVPRPDGTAVGFLIGQSGGLVDARTGDVHAWDLDGLPANVRSSLVQGGARSSIGYYRKGGYYGSSAPDGRLVDRTWSWTGMGLRGWLDGGVAVEIQGEGAVVVSPFSFDRVAHSGAFALARQHDGRVWQSTDRGGHWVEVGAPFLTRANGSAYSNELRTCSAIGCELGNWYRVGWVPNPPSPSSPPVLVTDPPKIDRESLPQLACKAIGEAKTSALARSESSPEDLGLGASRLPRSNDARSIVIVRSAWGRAALNPPHGVDNANDGEYSSLRAISWAYEVEPNGDSFVVSGPNKDIGSFRRNLSFLAPLDPGGLVRQASFGVSDLINAGRHLSLHAPDVFRYELHSVSGLVPSLSSDPAAPDDLLFFGGNSESLLVGLARSNGKSRVAVGQRLLPDAVPVSAASLGGDDFAVLEVNEHGGARVYKVGAAGAAPIELFTPPSSSSLRPCPRRRTTTPRTPTLSRSGRRARSPSSARRREASRRRQGIPRSSCCREDRSSSRPGPHSTLPTLPRAKRTFPAGALPCMRLVRGSISPGTSFAFKTTRSWWRASAGRRRACASRPSSSASLTKSSASHRRTPASRARTTSLSRTI